MQQYPVAEYDDRGNLTYYKDESGFERWRRYDRDNREIYYKSSASYEEWREYDEEGRLIYYKSFDKIDNEKKEKWYTHNEYGHIQITKQEFEKRKEKEFLGRKKVSRFKLMEVKYE